MANRLYYEQCARNPRRGDPNRGIHSHIIGKTVGDHHPCFGIKGMHEQSCPKPQANRILIHVQPHIRHTPSKPYNVDRRNVFKCQKQKRHLSGQFHQTKANRPDDQLFAQQHTKHKRKCLAKPQTRTRGQHRHIRRSRRCDLAKGESRQ